MNAKKIKSIVKKQLIQGQDILNKKLGIAVFPTPLTKKVNSNFNEEPLINTYLRELAPLENYTIDIAAGDGVTMSNTYALFKKGYKGLGVEFDAHKFYRLAFNYRNFSEVQLAKCMVTPLNILSLFAGYQVPEKPGFLSLDIDGYDHFVLDVLLSKYRPTLICVEINEKIPPPIKFTVKFDPSYRWVEDHFYGQSISQLHTLCEKYKYSLINLHYNNAFLVPSELNYGKALSPEEAYSQGYLNKKDRKQKFPYNSNLEILHNMKPIEAKEHLNQFFQKYKEKFIISI